jgi:hypothetical protein
VGGLDDEHANFTGGRPSPSGATEMEHLVTPITPGQPKQRLGEDGALPATIRISSPGRLPGHARPATGEGHLAATGVGHLRPRWPRQPAVSALTLVATFQARPGAREELARRLLEMVTLTRARSRTTPSVRAERR